MTAFVFVFPMPPNLANQSGYNSHWGVRYGAKRRYLATCDELQKYGRLPKPPAKPFPQSQLSSVMYLGRQMDDDNALSRHKWPLDWLKTRGYIEEDRKKNIQWTGFPEQRVGRKESYRIEITVRPLALIA